MTEDYYTNTEEDAGRFDRANAEPDERPTLSDVADFDDDPCDVHEIERCTICLPREPS